MGNCWTTLLRRNHTRRHIVLILIGLDNAGKTQTVNNLAGEKDDKVLPTVGFKAVNLIHQDTPVTIYDLGGGPQFRQIWPQYYSEVHGIIFVIDSSDFSRLEECKEVLEEVLSHDKVSGKPVLVLANKQDKEGALDDIDVVEKLNIEPLVNRYRCPTLVESYAASNTAKQQKKDKLDPGLKKGYQWLLNYIVKRYGDINLRVQTDIHSELERRQRLANKRLSSQTYTDLIDRTGFDNPNYISPVHKDILIVEPHNNSLNTTVTLESQSNSSVKPKLSPLFGRTSHGSPGRPKIELEMRNEFKKLSPLVNKKIHGQKMNFEDRPQSSPSVTKHKIIQVASKESSTNEDRTGDASREGFGDTWDETKTINLDKTFLSHSHRDDIRTEKGEAMNRGASSAVVLGSAGGATVGARPASASELVRRQLELAGRGAHEPMHRRRFSLRYAYRHRTSPARMALSRGDSTPGKDLERGDCVATPLPRANYLSHAAGCDLTM